MARTVLFVPGMQAIDLDARIGALVAAVRSAFATAVRDLPASAHEALARAAHGELAQLASPARPKVPFRPIVISEPSARPSALGDGVCTLADVVRLAPPQTVSIETETRIASVLGEQPRIGETIDAAFRRKEHVLGELFSALAPNEAQALHRRLATPVAGDAVAAAFARLVAERRLRLLAFLAGARRRQALRSA